jgi:hypothetical protein
MTVGCGMCYINTKIELNFSHKKTQENTVATHEAIQKYIHIYTSNLLTYAIYTTFKWMSHFLDNKNSLPMKNECVFKYHFSATLNHTFHSLDF